MALSVVQSRDRTDDSQHMARSAQRALLACLLSLLLLPAAASAKQTLPYSPSEEKSFDAVLTDWTTIMKTPGGESVFELQPATFYEDQPQRLLVLGSREVDGKRWLNVRLPAWFAHGMTSGWLNAERVNLHVNRWRVEISRAAGTLRILRDGQLVRMAHVATGTDSTPTPRGLHATYDHWRSTHAVLGEWTVSLTTHSPQVPVFDGMQAVVAIHGWHAGGGSSGAVSHGCIRVADDSIMRMVALELPVGTPVRVI
jgi:L,D-transpeptidase catalytic domain